MRCGFRPHDRDRTTERMGGGWVRSWAVVKRGWAAKREGFQATRLSVGVSNDRQMARNLTGGLPVLYQDRLARLGPFQESLTRTHEKREEGDAEGHRSAGSQNGQRGKCSDA